MYGLRGISIGSLLSFGAALVLQGGPSIPPQPELLRKRRRYASAVYGGSRTRTTCLVQHGKRERERRMRQIAAGSLRAENGLAV